jgi:hypothetical protein
MERFNVWEEWNIDTCGLNFDRDPHLPSAMPPAVLKQAPKWLVLVDSNRGKEMTMYSSQGHDLFAEIFWWAGGGEFEAAGYGVENEMSLARDGEER